MNILYLITKIITYPGAYLKGVWEHLACRMLRLPVRGRFYLQGNEWCGHAEHEPAMTPAKAFLLSFIPFVLQCVFGAVFLGASAGPLLIFGLRGGEIVWFLFFLEIVCLFLGISMACNAFPQWTDAKRQWHLFYGKPTAEELALMEAEIEEAAIEAIEEAEEEAEIDEEAATVLVEEIVITAEAPEGIGEAATEVMAEEDLCDEARDEDEAAQENDEAAQEDDDDEAAEEILGEADAAAAQPIKFAGLAGKIIFAPCNAFFLAGAWLERCGITTILALGITAALLVMAYA